MKQKVFVRVICVILSAVIVVSVAFIAISSITAGAVSAGQYGYINGSYVNLRSGAGTSYSVVTTMSNNTAFSYVDSKLYNDNWYKIKLLSNSKTGYVHKDYVKSATTTTGYVNSSDVNLRSGAGTNYSVVTTMSKNTKFTYISTSLYSSNWYHIMLSNGKTGYIYKSYATKDSTTSTSATTTSASSSTVTGYVNASDVNLRSGAGTSYSVVTTMSKNTQFTFISTSLYNSNWYNIKLSNGKTGYIYKTYATKNTTTTSTTTTTAATTAATTATTTGTLKITDTSETIYVGNKYVLYATGATSVSWSSSDTSVATVDSNGIVTAKKAGTATITAKSGSLKATSKITVKSGTSVNITTTSISEMSSGRSVLLKSTTSGVKWKTSNSSYATVDSGIVTAKKVGYVTITAYTSTGAASCLIYIKGRDPVRFTYASPNSAALNSTVKFYAITDTDRTAVRFVVSNGSTSYTIDATSKTKDGDNYLWTASKKLSTSGSWTIKAYAEFKNSGKYTATPTFGEGEVFVTTSTDTTTTVCSERRASDEIINLIADYEGFLSSLTPDNITSDPTVGYGKVITAGEQFYNNLTKNAAYAYLVKTVNSGGYTTRTNSFLLDNNIKFNQQQFDALVCFSYNLGASVIYNDADLQSVLLNTGTSSKITAGASGYVNASDVNLRSGAGTSYSVVKTMSKNTTFTFVSATLYNSNWYKIKLSDGTTGYIYSSYASVKDSTRDLANTSETSFVKNFFAYHHASGSCYWGLLYRRIDEAEVFFYGDYTRDGQNNKKKFSYTCSSNSSISI